MTFCALTAGADERRGLSTAKWDATAYDPQRRSDAIKRYVQSNGGSFPADVQRSVDHIARHGGTPLVVAENQNVLGVIELKDIVKSGMRERFAQLRRMGIRTVMITGDNPLTDAAIAAEAGVDDFMAEATPEDKLKAHPRRATRRSPGRHDRRWHQRCTGARPIRCWRGHEHRHTSRPRGWEYG
ncbi:MAG: HAD family hydrolase [Caldilineaceae bacterium]